MSIIQSAWAKGVKQITRPQTANAVHVQVFEHDFSKTPLAEGDILEIGAIPAYGRVVDAKLYATAAMTGVSVGLMSGEFGSTEATRTADASVFAAGNLTEAAITRLSLSAPLKLAAKDTDRGLGVKATGAISSGKLYLELLFVN